MAKEPRAKSETPERRAAPEGRETPVMGGRKGRKVRPLAGEAGIDRRYEPGTGEPEPENPWQDPGGPEPANG